MSCAVMYQPYSASPYQPQTQTQEAPSFVRGPSPTDPAAKEQKYKVCASPTDVAGAQTPPSRPEEDTAAAAQHNVKFLASNCVLVTNYCGDVANVVDEHFARALSHNGFETKHGAAPGKDSVPMTQRNLPASFWNSSYHSRSTVTSIGHGSGHDLYTDPYHSSALHGLHQSDPWHYALATQAAYPGRELAGYGGSTAGVAAAARFNGYSPLLFPAGSRLPTAVQPNKSDWSGRGYPDVPAELATHSHPHPHTHPHPHSHPLDPTFGAGAVGYGNVVTGLESSLHAAAGGKDSYWL